MEQKRNRSPQPLMRTMHIGEMIKKELERQERPVSWFARKLNYDRSNIYKLFRRHTIDAEVLLRISLILHHDFFEDYSEYYIIVAQNEVYEPTVLSEFNLKVQHKKIRNNHNNQ